jgi:hypothetical protein
MADALPNAWIHAEPITGIVKFFEKPPAYCSFASFVPASGISNESPFDIPNFNEPVMLASDAECGFSWSGSGCFSQEVA